MIKSLNKQLLQRLGTKHSRHLNSRKKSITRFERPQLCCPGSRFQLPSQHSIVQLTSPAQPMEGEREGSPINRPLRLTQWRRDTSGGIAKVSLLKSGVLILRGQKQHWQPSYLSIWGAWVEGIGSGQGVIRWKTASETQAGAKGGLNSRMAADVKIWEQIWNTV